MLRGVLLSLTCVLAHSVFASAEVIRVPAGGNLQAALDAAKPGDEIRLAPGATFTGEFRFPPKSGTVTLTSDSTLPDRRIGPADAPLLATIRSGVPGMAVNLYDSKHWTLYGIRFEPNANGHAEVIGIWRGEHITLRRLLIDVPDPQEQRRFILGNGRHITLSDSYCAGIWSSYQESQCFAAWDGAGPYVLRNNYLEAATENVIFGGADSSSEAEHPADILIEGNLMTKRDAWRDQPRGVKNVFELKAAKRVVVRNNVFEKNWAQAQAGRAIVFTPRNQDGKAPWTVVSDVLFERNVVRDTPVCFNLLGYDNIGASQQTTNITIRHNLCQTTGGAFALLANELGTVVLDHNTFLAPQVYDTYLMDLGAHEPIRLPDGSTRLAQFAVEKLTITDNLFQHHRYGIRSSLFAHGLATIAGMTKAWTWAGNVLGGGWGTYPALTTMLPADVFAAQFDAQYRLIAGSSLKGTATDGTDPGWHGQDAIEPPPPPPPPPPDPCEKDPLKLTNIKWPASPTGGTRSGSWNPNGKTLVRLEWLWNPQRVVATDSRGCTVTVTR